MRLELTDCVVEGNKIIRGGRERGLTTLERNLLGALRRRDGAPMTREELLVEVWGYDPDTNTRAVDACVRRLRTKLELDPRRPDHLLSEHGVGYRLLLPTRREAPTSDLVGRDRDLDRVDDAFGVASLVTLTGSGGVGKTRLAREWLAGMAATGERTAFCDCVHATDPEEVWTALCRTLDVHVGPEGPLAALQGRGLEGLLVLDNLEQLGVAGALTVAPLLDAGRVRILVTSRAPLELPDERVVGLAPLGPADAAVLFVERARRVVPEFSPTDSELADLHRELEGLPLSIELAAARMDLMTPAQLLQRLGRVMERPDGPARQRTLDDVVAWSWSLLGAAERDTLVRVAVIPGGFDLEAAEAVGPAGAINALHALLRAGLLRVDRATVPPRFQVFVHVRDFVHGYVEEEAIEAARVRMVHHYADLADRCSSRLATSEGMTARETLFRERTNLDRALELALDRRDGRRAVPLHGVTVMMCDLAGPLQRAVATGERLTELDLTPAERSAFLNRWVKSLARAGQVRRAEDLLRPRVEEDPESLGMLARMATVRGAFVESARLFEELLARSDFEPSGGTWRDHANSVCHSGRPEASVPLFERALAALEAEGDALGVVVARSMRSTALTWTGRLWDALADLRTVGDWLRDRGFHHKEGVARSNEAVSALRVGELHHALQAADRALAGVHGAGNLCSACHAHMVRARILLAMGKADDADRALNEAFAVAPTSVRWAAPLAATRGRVALARGEAGRALSAVGGHDDWECSATRARALALEGDPSAVDAVASFLADAGPASFDRSLARCWASEIHARVGSRDEAIHLRSLARRDARHLGVLSTSPLYRALDEATRAAEG